MQAIIDAVAPAKNDTIVEIGPGTGAITGPLAARAARLHAIELDRDLATLLEQKFSDQPKVFVHQADALQFDYSTLGRSLRIVGNLPYNVSTPLLFHLLEHRKCILDMHFMLQKEVVDRMTAQPGNKAYGRLGIMLGCHLEAAALFHVRQDAFDPPPAVTSTVVRLRPREDPPDIADEDLLGRLVSTAFSKRRKTLRNALRDEVDVVELSAVGLDSSLRPEQVPIAGWIALANRIANKRQA